MRTKRILLVEDDVSLRNAIVTFLTRTGLYEITTAGDARSAKIELSTNTYDLVLSDIRMPEGDGIDLLDSTKNLSTRPIFILMTGFGTIEQATRAMKLGAYDFLEKPFELSKLDYVIKSAFDDDMAVKPDSDDDPLPENSVYRHNGKVLITRDPKMLNLVENLKKIASSKATVLIQGKSGTGKEVLASMVHYYSPRRNHPFIAINCAAMPDNLLESELFGHEKGSFTGAIQRQIGKFEMANGGTILLDEISEMSMNMQTKLLRVLQEREIYRIGGNKPIPLNIRIIASTNRDLYDYMQSGHFREDLFYRINVVPVHVPALSERGQDVLELSEYFLEEFSRIHERERIIIDDVARAKIISHPWDGNVRELRNAMERVTLVGGFDQIAFDQSKQQTSSPNSLSNTPLNILNAAAQLFQSDLNGSLADIEKQFICETLKRCAGNRTKAAKHLGISLRTLRNKLKIFKMDDDKIVSF